MPSSMGSANGEHELSRQVEKVVGYPPLVEMGDGQRRDFHEALLEVDGFEDLRGSGRGRFSGQKGTGRSRVVRGH
jgi:hypothetical protein